MNLSVGLALKEKGLKSSRKVTFGVTSVACQVAEETIANDEVVVIRGGKSGQAVSVLLRGANDYMLDEMDRSLHDSFCVVKRVLESGAVVPGKAQMLLRTWKSLLLCSAQLSQASLLRQVAGMR